jgi:hypothetical protein
MKSIVKVAGLCLASMLAVSMAFVATASAAPVWEHCTKGAVSGLTKWENHNCSTISSEPSKNEWQWKEVNNTEEVRLKGSLRLKDTKTLAGTSEVECSGEGVGSVGPANHDRITEIKTSAAQCRAIKVCENVEEAEARNLPWQTEVFETENKVLDKILSTGNGEPGWKVTCKAPILGKTTDECLQEGAANFESILLENKATGTELLVLATFQHLRKAKCSQGGKESGEVTGSLAILQANGWGLRVS